jgi:transposase
MNILNVVKQETVLALLRHGWSYRRVARETGVHRETVGKIWQESLAGPKPAKVPTGFEREEEGAKPAKVPTRPRASCAVHGERIAEWLELGWSAVKIHRVLAEEYDYGGGYDGIKRFVQDLGRVATLPFRRIESAPGEEAQLDFGRAGLVLGSDGKRRKPWILRMVLSCSRRGYSEAIWRQDSSTVLAAIERGFRHLGGVPAKLVVDNFKAAVSLAEWSDAVLNPRMAAFARHYNVAVMPTVPRMPRHKGKIESGVHYVQLALRGEVFADLVSLNAFLLDWETSVADLRIHGTTKEQVLQRYLRIEAAALAPLPVTRFPLYEEGKRRVQTDAYVEVAKAYYSVPPEYVGRELWVRWDDNMIRCFDEQFAQVALHLRGEDGSFTTTDSHIDPRKRSRRELGPDALLNALTLIGPHSRTWGEGVLAVRGAEGERALVGVAGLQRQYGTVVLEAALGQAAAAGQWHLPEVREQCRQRVLERRAGIVLTQSHPLIRDLADYSAFAPFPDEPHSAQTTTA